MVGLMILLMTMVKNLTQEARQSKTLTLTEQMALMELKLQKEKEMGQMTTQKKQDKEEVK